MKSNHSEIIIYKSEDGVTKIDVTMVDETVWLALDQMAELFQRDKSTISRHIKNVFEEGELDRKSVVVNFATTASDIDVRKENEWACTGFSCQGIHDIHDIHDNCH